MEAGRPPMPTWLSQAKPEEAAKVVREQSNSRSCREKRKSPLVKV